MACTRCEISTFIQDNGADLIFVTEAWISGHVDRAKPINSEDCDVVWRNQ